METNNNLVQQNQITVRLSDFKNVDEIIHMNHLVPVEGYGSANIIGYWDENTDLFYAFNEEIFNDNIQRYFQSFIGMFNEGYPLVVNVISIKRDNSYPTYISAGKISDRTIIYIKPIVTKLD